MNHVKVMANGTAIGLCIVGAAYAALFEAWPLVALLLVLNFWLTKQGVDLVFDPIVKALDKLPTEEKE